MVSATIESVLQEDRLFPPSPEFVKQANVSGMAAYQAMCDEASRDFEGFWAKHAKNELMWDKPFTKTLDESGAPFCKWFEDGTLNASYNCLARQVQSGLGAKVALIFEVPLAFLLNPANRRRETRDLAGRQRTFYSIRHGGHEIWGATAAIIVDLAERLDAGAIQSST